VVSKCAGSSVYDCTAQLCYRHQWNERDLAGGGLRAYEPDGLDGSVLFGAWAHTHANGHSHSYACSHANGNTNSYSYPNPNANTNGYRLNNAEADTDGEAAANEQTAPNSCAAPLTPVISEK
jgi:hypothetical protein